MRDIYEYFRMGQKFRDKLLAITDVAFSNNMRKLESKSYRKTIDMTVGIYEGNNSYNGWLAISLKPSHGKLDWLINVLCFGRSHLGYRLEFKAFGNDIYQLICASHFQKAQKGIIIAGRSKGGAEAIMLAMLLRKMFKNIVVGAVDAPRAFGKKDAKEAFDTLDITSFCYKNDIVPSLLPWYITPGFHLQLGERTTGRSIKDHELATTKDELIYEEIEKICKYGL